jgi:hypothetical protein
VSTLIWTNSGDSHSLEPPNLYRDNMSAHFAERMPRSEWVDGQIITHIDGKTIAHRAPGGANVKMMEAMRAQGGNDNSKRMSDLDSQGVWGEVYSRRSGSGMARCRARTWPRRPPKS